jgi:hypothetical protein
MLKKTAYTCPKCGWTIYKRCKADLHTCYCGLIQGDGTILENKKPMINPDPQLVNSIVKSELEINTTERKMELDFLYNGCDYGTIKPTKGKK